MQVLRAFLSFRPNLHNVVDDAYRFTFVRNDICIHLRKVRDRKWDSVEPVTSFISEPRMGFNLVSTAFAGVCG